MGKYNEGITTTDHGEVEWIADGLGIDPADIIYRWDYGAEMWTAWQVISGLVIVQFAEKQSTGWIEV